MAEHVRGCNLLRPNHSGACCTCEPGSAVCKRGCPRRTPGSTPTEREAGDVGEVADPSRLDLAAHWCDWRILDHDAEECPCRMTTAEALAEWLAPLMAERERAAGARALREAARGYLHAYPEIWDDLRDRAAALAPETPEEQP